MARRCIGSNGRNVAVESFLLRLDGCAKFAKPFLEGNNVVRRVGYLPFVRLDLSDHGLPIGFGGFSEAAQIAGFCWQHEHREPVESTVNGGVCLKEMVRISVVGKVSDVRGGGRDRPRYGLQLVREKKVSIGGIQTLADERQHSAYPLNSFVVFCRQIFSVAGPIESRPKVG